jgi:hypothetical protein
MYRGGLIARKIYAGEEQKKIAPWGLGCAENPAKRFLVVALVVLKKPISPESL